jgi:hypothetical protein
VSDYSNPKNLEPAIIAENEYDEETKTIVENEEKK